MGDHRQAFEEAYTHLSDELFRHASMRLSDRDRALELTQECFLKTWEYVQKGNKIDEFRPFLYRTLRNLIIDEYRRKKSRSLESMLVGTEETDVEVLMPADESNTLEAAVDRFEGTRALKALQTLPDIYREVLILRYVESLSPKEIAEYIGESENAVSVRIHRGLKKLKSVLETDVPQPQL
jgi:RNA polymerase sigma-70 factor (ECF subfamily)